MGKRWGTRAPARSDSKANRLNTKLQTDNERRGHQSFAEQALAQASNAIADIPLPIPSMISLGAESQLEMLMRTKSTCSATTQNGVMVATYRTMESLRIDAKEGPSQGSTVDMSGDESTLPTFVSVDGSVNMQGDVEVIEGETLFRLSSGGITEAPMPTPASLGKSRASSGRTAQERDTRRKLRHKERLRSLTERLTTNAAVERSKDMLSNRMEKGKDVDEGDDLAEDGKNSTPEKNRCNNSILDGIKKKLYACSSGLCIDEAVIDHEGLIISVPSSTFHCDCGDGVPSAEPVDRSFSEVSSLTDPTHYRFVRRYWLNNRERRKDRRDLNWV